MKTMIKILAFSLIITFTVNSISYAAFPFPGSRVTVKVLGKKKKLSLESSYYSLKFNNVNVNKWPSSKKRKFLAFL